MFFDNNISNTKLDINNKQVNYDNRYNTYSYNTNPNKKIEEKIIFFNNRKSNETNNTNKYEQKIIPYIYQKKIINRNTDNQYNKINNKLQNNNIIEKKISLKQKRKYNLAEPKVFNTSNIYVNSTNILKNEIKPNCKNIKNYNENQNNRIKQNNNVTIIDKNNINYMSKEKINVNIPRQTGCWSFLLKNLRYAQNSLRKNFSNIKGFLSQKINDKDNECLLWNNLI